ncbi:MAG: molybdopterin molybdotransferase MoeA, partial [Armatimonadetes bacterium]|nr:molybdopterin molybdotransferase MoeA [Armatimonadota bacterium]
MNNDSRVAVRQVFSRPMLFFQVKSAEEARELLNPECCPTEPEWVSLDRAVGRITADGVRSPVDLPDFRRAVVDGYAVRAADTFGASPGQPAYLKKVGEIVMGRAAGLELRTGETARIATGGMVPSSADGVVMVEYTDSAGPELIEITRAAAPGEGLVEIGDDVRAGAGVLPAGRRLRPQDVGVLAGLGITRVSVHRLPRVAVIPTGDEIVAPEERPAPGQVRDVNTAAISAAVQAAGGVPIAFPIVRDDPDRLRATLEQALAEADLVLMMGGSSVGDRDWTLEVMTALPGAELLLHGVSIRPGKPVIGVRVGARLLIGLPGNPVSALVVFEQFVRPHLARLAGERPRLAFGQRILARL